MSQTIQIVFTPSGKRGKIPRGKTVLAAAQQLGVDLDTICGGRGICDRCQINLTTGNHPKHNINSKLTHLTPPTTAERQYFNLKETDTPTRRLGCQAQLLGDAVIDIPPESQAHRQVVRKRAQTQTITLRPALRLYYVEVPQPNMHDPSGDLQRLIDALEFEWNLTNLQPDFHLLPTLQPTLRADNWKVTAAIYQDRHLIALYPGFKPRAYGIAIDVGSTTIAAHLTDLSDGKILTSAGQMNPQIRFGEDLMSRVSYAMMNPGGEIDMTQAVQQALQNLITQLATDAKIPPQQILDITIVGNPVMHHLLLGINPVELGGAPFALATDQAIHARATDLNLTTHPGTRIYILPCIAGHVGADAAAATLSEAPYTKKPITLLVDVGTNAEIVLGNQDKLVAASSPTGPAFEGAQISGGQRAAPGAIERVRIDPKTLNPKYRIIGSDLWSDHPDFPKATSQIGITGICGSGIIEIIAELYLASVIKPDGTIDGEKATLNPDRIQPDGKTWRYLLHKKTKTSIEIAITQNDVRAIQLAKAALYAGAKLLMDKLNITHPDRIRLAGAFGAHIDVKHAMVLGMIPDCPLNQVASIGNAAGSGALIALLDQTARLEIQDAVNRIEKIETAVEPKFQDHFVAALAIPHKTADFTNLQKQVTLPTPPADSDTDPNTDSPSPRTRRRRRRARA